MGLLLPAGCRKEESHTDEVERMAPLSLPCKVALPRFPTTATDFAELYRDRGFLSDGNHLGRDIQLSEAQAVHPIGCGVIRVYRPAQGYGTLVVVIEHELPEMRMMRNGAGDVVPVKHFLSIYGHLRPRWFAKNDLLPWKFGDVVNPEDVIGYIENASDNGDGDEHLHLGIRLQSQVEAERADKSWFRGYDTTPTQRHWFADPKVFLSDLMTKGIKAVWHPPGTVLLRQQSLDYYVVGTQDELHWLPVQDAVAERLTERAISVSDEELTCYRHGSKREPEWPAARLVQFSDSDTIYQVREAPSPARGWFVSHPALRSWGWKASEIVQRSPQERQSFIASYQDLGPLLFREGSLIKIKGSSEISVISNGARRPIYDWATFTALGYRPEWIQELEPGSLKAAGYQDEAVITPRMVSECAYMGSIHRDLGSSQDLSVDESPADLNTLQDLSSIVPFWDFRTWADLFSPPVDMIKPSADLARAEPDTWRYEFRVHDPSWQASEPYRLRDKWWTPMNCSNTGSVLMQDMGQGWRRCDLSDRLDLFVGSFFSQAHPNWGDQGQLGTVGNAPNRCTPTSGVEWRISNLSKNLLIYQGGAAGLPCQAVGQQDRHSLL